MITVIAFISSMVNFSIALGLGNYYAAIAWLVASAFVGDEFVALVRKEIAKRSKTEEERYDEAMNKRDPWDGTTQIERDEERWNRGYR